MNCLACGGTMRPPEQSDVPYRSLPGVTLRNVDVHVCTACGARETEIPRIDELDTVLARFVATRPGRLRGDEVRFLRKVMGWSGRSFAAIFGVAPETVSRWETGKEPIGGVAERLLRVLVTQRIDPITDYYAFERWLQRLTERADDQPVEGVAVLHEPDGWRAVEP